MRFFVLSLATVAALVWCGIRVVSERNRSVALAYEIAAETRTQRSLEEELRQLRIDRAALLDPTRLTPIAKRNGLKVPTPDQVIVVEGGHGVQVHGGHDGP